MISWSKRQITIAAAGVGLILLLALTAAPGLFGTAEINDNKTLRVATQTAVMEDALTVNRTFNGRIEARREAATGFELGGMVSNVLVEEGQRIRRGSPLAKLDTAILRARRSELVSARNRASADRDLAQSTLDRLKSALERDAVSQQAVDEATRSLQASQAALAQSNAAIHSINVQIRKSVLRAPFNAVIVARMVDEGAVVASGTPVLNLLEDGMLEARFGVTGSAADILKRGRPVTITVADQKLAGSIKSVLPLKDRNSRSVDVIVELQVRAAPVRHGDLARLEVPIERAERGFWLPLTALTEDTRGIWAVYVAKPDKDNVHRLERRQLQIIHQETDRVFVRGTLKPGDQVVTNGLHRLGPGMTVELADTKPLNQSNRGGRDDG